jgi:hypothetical protein
MNAPAWIRITAGAVAAGTTAAAITYSIMSVSSKTAATSTGVLVDTAGFLVAEGARYFWGDIPATTVRIVGRMCSVSSEESVRYGGSMAALATAAVVGGTTAITVTVGTQLMYYTIEYGGALTKSAATAIAEAYLDYKGKHGSIIQSATPFECTATDLTDSMDLTDVSGESRESSNWLILDVAMPPSGETEEPPPPLQPI